ncbi:MAG: translation initiation factor Sui1 [Desulfosalsimonadaceae bacterium]
MTKIKNKDTPHDTNDTGLVYSTGHGKMCPVCNQPVHACDCRRKKAGPPGDGIVRVGRETKGRGGKGVTVISGAPLDHEGLKLLTKELKAHCGTGGTLKECVIEIQGDHRETIVAELRKKGWTVKRSGG